MSEDITLLQIGKDNRIEKEWTLEIPMSDGANRDMFIELLKDAYRFVTNKNIQSKRT